MRKPLLAMLPLVRDRNRPLTHQSVRPPELVLLRQSTHCMLLSGNSVSRVPAFRVVLVVVVVVVVSTTLYLMPLLEKPPTSVQDMFSNECSVQVEEFWKVGVCRLVDKSRLK